MGVIVLQCPCFGQWRLKERADELNARRPEHLDDFWREIVTVLLEKAASIVLNLAGKVNDCEQGNGLQSRR